MSSWKKTFVCAWFAQFCSMTAFTFIMPLMPFYLAEMGITDEHAIREWQGIVGCAAGLTMVLVAPFWGILADRYGRKLMVIRSMFAGVLILGLMAFARGPADLVLLRIAQGALTGSITASAALIASIAPPRHSGLALGMMYGAVSGGMALGPLIAGILADRFSFRATYLVGSVILLVAGILVTLGTREEFTPPARESRRQTMSFKVLLISGGFVLACVIYFLISFSNWGRAITFPLLMRQLIHEGVPQRGLSGFLLATSQKLAGVRAPETSLNGLVLFVAGLAAMCAAPLWGRLGDKWGHQPVLIVCCLLAGILAIPTGFAKSVGGLFIWSIFLWTAASGAIPCINTIVRRTIGRHNIGKAYGLTQCVSALGWGLGPLATGYAASYVGIWASFVTIGAALLVAPLVVGLLPKSAT